MDRLYQRAAIVWNPYLLVVRKTLKIRDVPGAPDIQRNVAGPNHVAHSQRTRPESRLPMKRKQGMVLIALLLKTK